MHMFGVSIFFDPSEEADAAIENPDQKKLLRDSKEERGSEQRALGRSLKKRKNIYGQ